MTDQPIPPVSLFRLFVRMGGWIVLIFGVFLLIFTLISHVSIEAAKRFETEGERAVATVHERYTTTSRDADGDTTTSYWLEFSFITADKQDIRKAETVGTALYRSVGVGDTFELLYLPSNPEKVETAPGSNRTMSRITQAIAMVFGLIWLAGLWRVGSWAVAAVRARKYGLRHTVKVRRVDRSNVRFNNRARYRVVWQGPDGQEGRSLLHREARVRDLSAGDEIEIYQGVKTGWWVGDVGERAG